MKNKGFSHAIELAIAIAAFFIIISAITPPETKLYDEIIISQKMHDILLVWAKENLTNEKEMQSDFEFLFQGKNGEIEINNKKIQIQKNQPNKKKFSEEIKYFDNNSSMIKIRLVVFN